MNRKDYEAWCGRRNSTEPPQPGGAFAAGYELAKKEGWHRWHDGCKDTPPMERNGHSRLVIIANRNKGVGDINYRLGYYSYVGRNFHNTKFDVIEHVVGWYDFPTIELEEE